MEFSLITTLVTWLNKYKLVIEPRWTHQLVILYENLTRHYISLPCFRGDIKLWIQFGSVVSFGDLRKIWLLALCLKHMPHSGVAYNPFLYNVRGNFSKKNPCLDMPLKTILSHIILSFRLPLHSMRCKHLQKNHIIDCTEEYVGL